MCEYAIHTKVVDMGENIATFSMVVDLNLHGSWNFMLHFSLP